MSEYKHLLWDGKFPAIPIICERKSWKTCPEHKHLTSKMPVNRFKPDVDEAEIEESVADYHHPQFENIIDLSEGQERNLRINGFLEFDGLGYRLKEDGESLESFSIYSSLDEMPESLRSKLEDNYFAVNDGVGYSLDEYGEIDLIFPDPKGAEYMKLNEWGLESLNGITVAEYAAKHQGDKLNPEVESIFQEGGCAVYALSLKELNPNYEIAVDVWDCDGERMYNHVFCVDPLTGKAYDSRGEFKDAESLLDYASDKGYNGLVHKNSEYYDDLGYIFWDVEETKFRIKSGVFTYDDSPEDMEIVKTLITEFKHRFSA
jgi:hypothetical protein